MPHPAVIPWAIKDLLRRLASGQWPSGSRLPPTRLLAARLGVARRTLLAALRVAARHGLLEVRPRQRILVLPGAARYARARLARAAGRAARLAILIPDQYLPIKEPFYSLLVHEIVREAARTRLAAEIVAIRAADQLRADAALLHCGYRAALCIAFGPAHLPALVLLRERGFPVMTFNRRLSGLDVPSVRVDDYGTARRVATLLAGLGHRDLCLVSGILGASPWSGTGRTAGWTDALRDLGLLNSCSHPLYVTHPVAGAGPFSRAFEALMRLSSRPTALVFCGAPPAQDFLTDPRFRRLRVPEDLSAVVLEPGPKAVAVPGGPSLTSARINEHRAAQCCIEMAAQLLAGNLRPPCVRLSSDLTVTDSIAAPRAGTVAVCGAAALGCGN
jgi:DNA-binding LacI/PurR family transcriptional regulator